MTDPNIYGRRSAQSAHVNAMFAAERYVYRRRLRKRARALLTWEAAIVILGLIGIFATCVPS